MKYLTIASTAILSTLFALSAIKGNHAHALEVGEPEPRTVQCNYVHNDDASPYHSTIIRRVENCPEAPEPLVIHNKIGPHDCTIFIFRM